MFGFFSLGMAVNHRAMVPIVFATQKYTPFFWLLLVAAVVLAVVSLASYGAVWPLLVTLGIMLLMFLSRLRNEEWSLDDLIENEGATIREEWKQRVERY